jgi:mannose-1-phosphate guanylyltransferase
MITIGGQPMIDIWLAAFAKAGVDEVLVNLHHLDSVVREHIARRVEPPHVRLVYEPVLLGSAGTLLVNRDFVAGEAMFLAVNADNLTDFDLGKLVDAHRPGVDATLTLFRAPRPSECGIVEVVGDEVVGYVEKPAEPRSDLANAGMYAFTPGVLDLIDAALPRDIGFDLLPKLVGRANAVTIDQDCFLLDIGTPAALERARNEWRGGQAS